MIRILQILNCNFRPKILFKKSLLILSLILFFSISCQTPINEISENGFIDSTESLYPTLDKNATIFTIPSPTQVVSTLKIINAPFQDE